MIPKKIHYCWFGKNPKPEIALKCIESWKRFFPEYEIIEWNEENFDLTICEYVEEAYSQKKWAFVSDYARFWVLYQHGGVYFDTDVEVLKAFSEVTEGSGFIGREYHKNNTYPVNPGLGMAAEKGSPLLKELLDNYSTLHFTNPDNSVEFKTVVDYTTEILIKYGLNIDKDGFQQVAGIRVFPTEFFSPQNMYTGEVKRTDSTLSIHYYSGSWDTITVQKGLQIKRDAVSRYGVHLGKIVYLVKYSIFILRNDGIIAFFKKLRSR